ncbi:ATP-binding protein [Corallococcus terminator]
MRWATSLLTPNLAFSDWPGSSPNGACATALIDRVIHHADILSIEGQSNRRRASEESAVARKTKAKPPGRWTHAIPPPSRSRFRRFFVNAKMFPARCPAYAWAACLSFSSNGFTASRTWENAR